MITGADIAIIGLLITIVVLCVVVYIWGYRVGFKMGRTDYKLEIMRYFHDLNNKRFHELNAEVQMNETMKKIPQVPKPEGPIIPRKNDSPAGWGNV